MNNRLLVVIALALILPVNTQAAQDVIIIKRPTYPAPKPRPAGPPPSPKPFVGIDAQSTQPIKPVKSNKPPQTDSSTSASMIDAQPRQQMQFETIIEPAIQRIAPEKDPLLEQVSKRRRKITLPNSNISFGQPQSKEVLKIIKNGTDINNKLTELINTTNDPYEVVRIAFDISELPEKIAWDLQLVTQQRYDWALQKIAEQRSSSPTSVTMVETFQQPVVTIGAQPTLPAETAAQPAENYTHTFDGKVTAYGKSQGHADVNTKSISMSAVRQFNNSLRNDPTSITPENVASKHKEFGTKPGMKIAPKDIQLEMPAPESPSTPKQPEQNTAYNEAEKAAQAAQNKAPQKALKPGVQNAKISEPVSSNLQQSRFQLWKDQIRNYFSKDNNIRTMTNPETGAIIIKTYKKEVKINNSTIPTSTKVIPKKSTPNRSWSLFGKQQ